MNITGVDWDDWVLDRPESREEGRVLWRVSAGRLLATGSWGDRTARNRENIFDFEDLNYELQRTT